MKTAALPRDVLLAEGRQQMQVHLNAPDLSLRSRIALACRILFDYGHDSGLAGQITARADEEGTYWTQALGLGFDEINYDNLLLVDSDLQVLSGTGMANPANRFHSWVYSKRPDVQCIIHTHPLHTCALSMLGIPLKVSQMDSCMLYDDVAYLEYWPGVPVGNEEGMLIAEVLQHRRAALLAHHGLIVAATSVEEACVLALQIERTARMQLLAQAVGPIRELNAALALEAHDWILQSSRSRASFAYFGRQIMKRMPYEEVAQLVPEVDSK